MSVSPLASVSKSENRDFSESMDEVDAALKSLAERLALEPMHQFPVPQVSPAASHEEIAPSPAAVRERFASPQIPTGRNKPTSIAEPVRSEHAGLPSIGRLKRQSFRPDSDADSVATSVPDSGQPITEHLSKAAPPELHATPRGRVAFTILKKLEATTLREAEQANVVQTQAAPIQAPAKPIVAQFEKLPRKTAPVSTKKRYVVEPDLSFTQSRFGISLVGWIGLGLGVLGAVIAVLAAPGWI